MNKQKRLRIFFNSNAPWSISGYANQMAEVLPLMRDEGYPLALCAFYGLDSGKLLLDGVLTYGRIGHVYGSDAMIHHAKDFKADVVFSLQDQWVLNPEDLKQVNRYIAWTPIDHEPTPKPVLEKLRLAWRIVTYSKFGHHELQKEGLNSTYIQHTVNTDIFRPLNKEELKRNAKLPPNSYIVGMIAANKENPPRKSFQEAMDAFKIFLQLEKNAYLYLHTYPDQAGGFPIKAYADFIGIAPKVLYPDAYQMTFNTGKEQMAQIYNCMDMLLLPSVSEGFGVPVIEAASCGVPAVVNNFASMPELVKEGITGEICKVSYKRFSHLMSYTGVPDVKSLYDGMCRIRNGNKKRYAEEARKFMVENYDTKKVYKEKWSPYLETLEEEVYGIIPKLDPVIQKTVDKK